MSSPILPVQGPSAPTSDTAAPATAEIAGLAAFAGELAGGASVPAIDAARGGPPPEVLDQIARAAQIADRLREDGYQLRFFSDAPGQRPRIELHDEQGEAIGTLSTAQALELAAEGPAAGELVV